MKIGIIVAMEKELRLLLPLIEDKRDAAIRGMRIVEGRIGTHTVAAMQCGIGKVNSALSTLALIEEFKPDHVINTGVAGGADKQMHVLDTFVADAVAYHDVWCGPGTEYGAAHGFEVMLLPDPAVGAELKKHVPQDALKSGLICSGDKFIVTPEEVAEIKSHFPECLAVDMESASIAQVCTLKGVPFNIVRVISDTPGEPESISMYENFWSDAPTRTFAVIEHWLKS